MKGVFLYMLRCPSSANDAGKCPFLRDSALESFHSSGLRMPNTFRTQKASQLRLARAKYFSYTESITAQACACQMFCTQKASQLRLAHARYFSYTKSNTNAHTTSTCALTCVGDFWRSFPIACRRSIRGCTLMRRS